MVVIVPFLIAYGFCMAYHGHLKKNKCLFSCTGSLSQHMDFLLRWPLLLWSMGSRALGLQWLPCTHLVAPWHVRSPPGFNPCPLHWQADSWPPDYRQGPAWSFWILCDSLRHFRKDLNSGSLDQTSGIFSGFCAYSFSHFNHDHQVSDLWSDLLIPARHHTKPFICSVSYISITDSIIIRYYDS